jgi:hypothetical protein
VGGSYAPIATSTLPDGTLVVPSTVLGLDLQLTGRTLHFVNPTTGQKLLSHREAEQARQEAEARAATALAALQAAQDRIAELEARLRERPQEAP